MDRQNNWLVNYDEIDEIVKPIINELDHKTLNEIKGLENPTSENLARWLYKRIKKIKNLKVLKYLDLELVDVFIRVVNYLPV